MIRETLAEGEEGTLHLGPERPQVYYDLSPEDKERYNADIWATNILLQRLLKDMYTLINHYNDAKNIWDRVKMLMEDLALNVDNVFQEDDCDVFRSDVDEAPTAQTMFMANLSSAYHVYDKVGPSYDSDILSEVHDHDNYHDAICEHHDVHEMHDDVQPNCIVGSDAKYIGENNMILYDQVVVQNVQGHQNRGQGNNASGTGAVGTGGAQKRVGSVNSGQARLIMCYNCNDYLKHLQESVATLREIIEEAKAEIPLDRSLASARLYNKHSQELLEYVIGTWPNEFSKRAIKQAITPLNRITQVTFENQCEPSNNNTLKHVEQLNIQKTNVPVIPSTRVNSFTDASESKPRSNTKTNRISPANSVNKKKVEEHHRRNKSSRKKSNRVDSSISSKRAVVNSNSHSVCKTCHKCLIYANHDMCVASYLNPVNASSFVKNVVHTVKKVVQIVLWYLDSGCSKHMSGDRSRLRNFVKKFIGTLRFRNDHFGAIMGYEDYLIGDNVISRVYYVEGL
nr:integrase, catalytic region, zinc finger, CCHC-type, peptidase aspartic, catalytic [Tanacetum cinerariifolium]